MAAGRLKILTLGDRAVLKIDIKIKRLDKSLPMPEYKTKGAAGFDLRASLREGDGPSLDQRHVYLHPGEIVRVPVGLAFEFPEYWVGALCPRSGLALKGVGIVNSPGVIDSDFRGEVSVMLVHHGVPDGLVMICHGDRIAQMVMLKTVQVAFEEVEALSETDRGTGGYGHTGIK